MRDYMIHIVVYIELMWHKSVCGV